MMMVKATGFQYKPDLFFSPEWQDDCIKAEQHPSHHGDSTCFHYKSIILDTQSCFLLPEVSALEGKLSRSWPHISEFSVEHINLNFCCAAKLITTLPLLLFI